MIYLTQRHQEDRVTLGYLAGGVGNRGVKTQGPMISKKKFHVFYWSVVNFELVRGYPKPL